MLLLQLMKWHSSTLRSDLGSFLGSCLFLASKSSLANFVFLKGLLLDSKALKGRVTRMREDKG